MLLELPHYHPPLGTLNEFIIDIGQSIIENVLILWFDDEGFCGKALDANASRRLNASGSISKLNSFLTETPPADIETNENGREDRGKGLLGVRSYIVNFVDKFSTYNTTTRSHLKQ
jgi:hypothetical protein